MRYKFMLAIEEAEQKQLTLDDLDVGTPFEFAGAGSIDTPCFRIKDGYIDSDWRVYGSKAIPTLLLRPVRILTGIPTFQLVD